MLWVLNKNNNTPYVFGSVAALSETLGINSGTLYNHFSRNKKTEYENNDYRIVKLEITRSTKD